jgi:hypothetical protein
MLRPAWRDDTGDVILTETIGRRYSMACHSPVPDSARPEVWHAREDTLALQSAPADPEAPTELKERNTRHGQVNVHPNCQTHAWRS